MMPFELELTLESLGASGATRMASFQMTVGWIITRGALADLTLLKVRGPPCDGDVQQPRF